MLDMALWDVAAKIEGTPLWRILSERYNEDRHHDLVPVYATGGHYYPDGDLEALREEIRGYTDQGYERIKIKCGQGDLADDCSRIEAALSVLDGDGSRLAVDVNCMCSTSGDTQKMADAYSPYGLSWIEEPGHPHDFELLKALTDYYEGAIATGENLFSMSETYNLLIYGGLRGDRDLIQVDPALSYGMVEYANILLTFFCFNALRLPTVIETIERIMRRSIHISVIGARPNKNNLIQTHNPATFGAKAM